MKERVKKNTEDMKFGSKGHKSVMPTHYAAEASGVKRNKLRPEKTKSTKTKSLVKRKVVKK